MTLNELVYTYIQVDNDFLTQRREGGNELVS